MVAAPVNQGSMRIVKEPGNNPGEEMGAIGGEKVRRNAVSPFIDFTVNDMMERNGCDNYSAQKGGRRMT